MGYRHKTPSKDHDPQYEGQFDCHYARYLVISVLIAEDGKLLILSKLATVKM
jgi:hypothetical protein